MRFRLPHRPHLRPAWMIRIGLFMYDHLGKRTSLPGSTGLRFGAESVLKPEIVRGFEYSDCWVDDARLVLANAQMVVRKGGEVRTRTRAISAKRENGLWVVEAEDIDSGEKFTWKARGLVNATGPWVKQFFDEGMHLRSPYGIRLIRAATSWCRECILRSRPIFCKTKINVLCLLSRGWMSSPSSARRTSSIRAIRKR